VLQPSNKSRLLGKIRIKSTTIAIWGYEFVGKWDILVQNGNVLDDNMIPWIWGAIFLEQPMHEQTENDE